MVMYLGILVLERLKLGDGECKVSLGVWKERW